jgi:hypothetical protein
MAVWFHHDVLSQWDHDSYHIIGMILVHLIDPLACAICYKRHISRSGTDV